MITFESLDIKVHFWSVAVGPHSYNKGYQVKSRSQQQKGTEFPCFRSVKLKRAWCNNSSSVEDRAVKFTRSTRFSTMVQQLV